MKKIVKDLDDLEVYLDKAIKYLSTHEDTLDKKLKEGNYKLSLADVKKAFNTILSISSDWKDIYSKNSNVLDIGLRNYKKVDKESSYLLANIRSFNELYIEHIDLCIDNIGNRLINEINTGGRPTKK